MQRQAFAKSSRARVNDLDGVAISDGPNGTGNPGFPGFDPLPSQTLGYLASMLEAGVPVVYGYIEDAHDANNFDFPTYPDGAFGPGKTDYVAQLKKFDAAFGKFFARLAKHGFTKDNTLFVITADENDHFAGAAQTPAGCDGIKVACTYPNKGEVDANLNKLFQGEFFDSTPFNINFDMAPGIWIDGNPAQTDPAARKLEREAAGLTGFDPITGLTNKITKALADHAEQRTRTFDQPSRGFARVDQLVGAPAKGLSGSRRTNGFVLWVRTVKVPSATLFPVGKRIRKYCRRDPPREPAGIILSLPGNFLH